jgi:hypothetical protein
MNNGKPYTLLAYFLYNNLVPHVLASILFQEYKSTIGGKHTQNTGKMHRRSYPTITQRWKGDLADQMGASRHKSPRITTRAHMPASQRKVEPRVG